MCRDGPLSTDVEIDGVAELWYDDRDSMLRALATPEGRRR